MEVPRQFDVRVQRAHLPYRVRRMQRPSYVEEGYRVVAVAAAGGVPVPVRVVVVVLPRAMFVVFLRVHHPIAAVDVDIPDDDDVVRDDLVILRQAPEGAFR